MILFMEIVINFYDSLIFIFLIIGEPNLDQTKVLWSQYSQHNAMSYQGMWVFELNKHVPSFFHSEKEVEKVNMITKSSLEYSVQ